MKEELKSNEDTINLGGVLLRKSVPDGTAKALKFACSLPDNNINCDGRGIMSSDNRKLHGRPCPVYHSLSSYLATTKLGLCYIKDLHAR